MTRTNIPGTSPYEPVIGFSRAVRIGNEVHVSGTGPVGSDDKDVAEQTDQCLTIIAAALQERRLFHRTCLPHAHVPHPY